MLITPEEYKVTLFEYEKMFTSRAWKEFRENIGKNLESLTKALCIENDIVQVHRMQGSILALEEMLELENEVLQALKELDKLKEEEQNARTE